MNNSPTSIYVIQGFIFLTCALVSVYMILWIRRASKMVSYARKFRHPSGRFWRVCYYHSDIQKKGVIALLVSDGSCDFCNRAKRVA